MDIIQLDKNVAPIRLIDVKFPKDDIDEGRFKDYKKMARKSDAGYETFDVTKKCPDWPEKCPNQSQSPQTEPAPASEATPRIMPEFGSPDMPVLPEMPGFRFPIFEEPLFFA